MNEFHFGENSIFFFSSILSCKIYSVPSKTTLSPLPFPSPHFFGNLATPLNTWIVPKTIWTLFGIKVQIKIYYRYYRHLLESPRRFRHDNFDKSLQKLLMLPTHARFPSPWEFVRFTRHSSYPPGGLHLDTHLLPIYTDDRFKRFSIRHI